MRTRASIHTSVGCAYTDTFHTGALEKLMGTLDSSNSEKNFFVVFD